VTSSTLSASSFLWEYGASDSDLGNVINKPLVGMLENGATPVVIVGNGTNSVTGKATLLVLNAKTGGLVRKCTPSNAANAKNNGMGPLSFVSLNNNGKINFVYGADYLGNVWRMDPNLTGTGCGTNAELIFSATYTGSDAVKRAQPITGEMTVISAPSGKSGYMLTFGTGSYITAGDPGSTDVQSLYGIWDDLGTGGITRADLVAQQIITTSTLPGTRTTTAVTTEPSSANMAWYAQSGKKGWYLDLTCSNAALCPSGERMVSTPTWQNAAAGPRLWFLTLVPSTDPCKVSGGGWLTSLDPTSGGYVKGFETLTQNSTTISGVAPRGLFFVQRTATTTNPTTNILFVSVRITSGAVPTPQGLVSSGGIRIGSDGSGTGVLGFGVSANASTTFGTRRQVWRQIQ
jgi:type IV pilus assembly protein PilY1